MDKSDLEHNDRLEWERKFQAKVAKCSPDEIRRGLVASLQDFAADLRQRDVAYYIARIRGGRD